MFIEEILNYYKKYLDQTLMDNPFVEDLFDSKNYDFNYQNALIDI